MMTLKQIKARVVEIDLALETADKKERPKMKRLEQEREGLITRARKNFGAVIARAKQQA